jgi:TetR/AcrR family transcriptional regulator, copper-responsive repressor
MRNSTKRRGRPPSYDRAAAVDAFTSLFWQKGFAATSLDEIARETGMNRPSLYAAFGDKRAMYLLALKSFADQANRGMADALSRPSLREALLAFYDQAITVYTAGPFARGCLIACSGAHEAANDNDVRATVVSIFQGIHTLLEGRFQCASEAGDLLRHIAPDDAARLASCVLQSLAVQARAGMSRADLQMLASSAIKVVSANVQK